MSDKIITLATFTYPTETFLLKGKLDEAGIRSFIGNEHLVSTQPLLSNAVGGVTVQIAAADLEKATRVLKEMEAQKKDAEKQFEADFGTGYTRAQTFCPECESSNVYQKKGSFFSFGAKQHVCADCRYVWKQ